jgi:hypothetical protein
MAAVEPFLRDWDELAKRWPGRRLGLAYDSDAGAADR